MGAGIFIVQANSYPPSLTILHVQVHRAVGFGLIRRVLANSERDRKREREFRPKTGRSHFRRNGAACFGYLEWSEPGFWRCRTGKKSRGKWKEEETRVGSSPMVLENDWSIIENLEPSY
jgi:hypothetical protein